MLPLPEPLVNADEVLQPFAYPRSKSYPLTESWESGGIALSDSSGGLEGYVWQAWTDGETITVKRDDLTDEHVLITDIDITEVDLTFDQNMRPCIAYVANGISKLYWYDSQQSMQVIDEYPNIKNPRVSLDDKRRFNIANSDIIFAYVFNYNQIRYRLQRERYLIEHELLVDDNTSISNTLELVRIGMGTNLRFLFETN